MRKFLFVIVILLATTKSHAQVQQAWAVSHFAMELHDQVVDASGNVYVTGRGFSADQGGIITFKYNKSGVEIWRKFLPGSYYPNVMTIDVSGNVYIAAEYRVQNGTERHFYTIKLSSATGGIAWTNGYFDHDKFGIPSGIAVDIDGNVYVTGVSHTALMQGENPFPDRTTADYATIKYYINGEEAWVRRYNGSTNGFDGASEMVVDAFGNIYVTGTSELNGQSDAVTIKYSTGGDIIWLDRHDEAGFGDGAADIKLDAAGNVIVGGSTLSLSGDQSDMLAIKYTFSGFKLWAKRAYNNMSAIRFTRNVEIDNSGNIVLLGHGGSPVLVKFNPAGDQLWLKEIDGIFARIAGDLATDGSNLYLALLGGGMTTIKVNSGGNEVWRKVYETVNNDAAYIKRIGVDANQNVFSSSAFDFLTVGYTQCNIVCPSTITVNADAGKCDAVVNFSDVTTTGDCGSPLTYSHASGATFPVGTTTVTVSSDATGASCSFNITVVDNVNPVINCPANKTVNTDAGVCYTSSGSVNAGVASGSDACNPVGVVGVRSDGASLGANYPVGVTTIVWRATDPSNNTATCSQTITVVDNVPPTIAGESASTYVLSPPNHTMRDVTVSYTATDNCAVTSIITVTSNEPINGVGDGDTDPDWIITDNHHVKLRAERSAHGTGRIYTITITATDPSGNTSVKTVEVRVPHDIKNPHSGRAYIVGSTVPFEGEFWDKPGNKHTAKWLIDDNTTAKAIVIEPSGSKNGKVTGSYKFTAPGVYKLQMNVTDQTGVTHYANTSGDLEAIVVIYDPNGGHTYGGGYYNSPAGALKSNPAATGKASYGFAMNYFKNSTYPKGETQFEFKVGSFEFNALNFEYLVISNSMAQIKGTGKIIGGQSGVAFTMTVTDGQLDGSGIDKIRMKIYNKNNGSIIYDNQPGASDAALPTQTVGANSTIVINGNNSNITSANTYQKEEMESKVAEISNDLDVIAFPNPTANNFTMNVKANNKTDRITMQVADMYGRIIETRNVNANSLTRFGDRYNPGTYFVRIVQGKQSKVLKLVKLSD